MGIETAVCTCPKKMVGSRSSHQLPTAGTAMFLVIFASFLYLCAAESPVAYKTIKVVNNCAFPVWPAIVGSSDLPTPKMRKLKAGESFSWKADPFWSGSIWGRTGCVFNSRGLGGCDSGDCGGTLQCKDDERTADITAITKAEFELLGGIAKPDTFTVSLEKGYNLPMSVVPSYMVNNISRSRPCESMACTADANTVCPKKTANEEERECGYSMQRSLRWIFAEVSHFQQGICEGLSACVPFPKWHHMSSFHGLLHPHLLPSSTPPFPLSM